MKKVFEKRKDDNYTTYRINTSACTSLDFSINNLRNWAHQAFTIAITPHLGIGLRNPSNTMRFAFELSFVIFSLWFCVWKDKE